MRNTEMHKPFDHLIIEPHVDRLNCVEEAWTMETGCPNQI